MRLCPADLKLQFVWNKPGIKCPVIGSKFKEKWIFKRILWSDNKMFKNLEYKSDVNKVLSVLTERMRPQSDLITDYNYLKNHYSNDEIKLFSAMSARQWP